MSEHIFLTQSDMKDAQFSSVVCAKLDFLAFRKLVAFPKGVAQLWIVYSLDSHPAYHSRHYYDFTTRISHKEHAT